MKTNSPKQQKHEAIIEKQLKKIQINKIARQSGFYKRAPRKIKAKNLFISLLMIIGNSKNTTYSLWANKLGLLINSTVSKQAIAKRMNKELVELLREMLKAIMRKDVAVGKKEKIYEKLKSFKRILIEDSTSIRLTDKLAEEYPSCKKYGKEHGRLKIQVVYEAVKKRFLNLEVTSFRRNDQGYAREILKIVKPGDLLIRDLGYFILKVFRQFREKGVYFISLAKKEVKIYLRPEEESIDLASMLKKRGNLDIDVFLGQQEKTPARLIAIPVEPEVASSRRRKAKKQYNQGWSRRKDYYFLLGWNLLITNIPREQLSDIEIYRMYSLRWRIEIIFKSWKSCFGITRVPTDGNKIRLEVFIYCMLIYILLFQVHYYNYYTEVTGKQTKAKPPLSLLKFMNFIISNINLLIDNIYLKILPVTKEIKRQLAYHCTYELRKNRVNYNQSLLFLS